MFGFQSPPVAIAPLELEARVVARAPLAIGFAGVLTALACACPMPPEVLSEQEGHRTESQEAGHGGEG